MSDSFLEDKLLDHRLDRAANHVSDYWIPMNPALEEKVQSGLAEGYYDSRIDELVQDIQSDLSLFSGCLCRLVELMNEAGEEIPVDLHPQELLRQAGVQRLREVLALAGPTGRPHELECGSGEQLQRFREAIVSATTSKCLANTTALDPEACYAAGLLRQLGLTLIAWNYPAVYQEAVLTVSTGVSLEERITEELGFSPALLAMRVFSRFGFPVEYIRSIGVGEEEEAVTLSAIGDTVAGICKVGEALARAQSPSTYPNARDDWEFAKEEISRRLGKKGMQIIYDALEESLASYLDIVPEVFQAGLICDLDETDFTQDAVIGEYYNPYLSQCRARERSALKNLYSRLSSDVRSGDNLRIFTRETFISTEFSGGVVYTIDPSTLKLAPQLQLGEVVMRELEPIEYALAEACSDMVAVAYRSSEPVIAYGVDDNGDLISMIAGIFGATQRAGVLYLEIQGLLSDDPVEVMHFRAMQHALNDCLAL